MEPIVYNRINENNFSKPFVTVDKRFRFSQGAIAECSLKAGQFLHVVEFPSDNGKPSEWFFIVNSDSNGFRLCQEGYGISAHCAIIADMFLKRVMHNGSHSYSFIISKTSKEFKGFK